MFYVSELYDNAQMVVSSRFILFETFEEARDEYVRLITRYVANNKFNYKIPSIEEVKQKDVYDCWDYSETDYTTFKIGKAKLKRHIGCR